MKPAAFDYVRAETADEAVQQLKALGPEARILAGGQSLERISNLAGDSSARVSAIAAAATEQSAASEEINRNIAEVNTLSAHIAEAMDMAARQVSDMAGQVSVVTGILDVIRQEDKKQALATEAESKTHAVRA